MAVSELQIEKLSVTDKICRILSDEILTGLIPPGSHLNESGLAGRFAISRTPIREALGQIVASGLAERRIHHGVYVIATPTERLGDMFELSSDLEGNCARHAARRMSDEEKVALKQYFDHGQEAADLEDVESYETFNLRFHEMICLGCHNPYLIEAANVARTRLMPYRRVQFRAQKRVTTSHEEHREIVRAILNSEDDDAEHLMRDHMLKSFRASQEMLEHLFGIRQQNR